MHKFRQSLLMGSLYLLVTASAQAEEGGATSGLKALMTPEQYQNAGMHKLSEEERTALYQWMRDNAGKVPANQVRAAPTAAAGVPPAAQAATVSAAVSAAAPAAAPETAVVPAATTAVVAEPVPAAAEAVPASPTVATSAAATPVAAAAPAPSIEESFGLPELPEDSPEAQFKLNATVKAPFRGWSGKTVFYLDNGQVWRQRSHGRYTYMGDDARVVISKNRMGFYEMRLVEADRSIGVKRVK